MEIGILALLIVINGVFALSEMSVVSARRPRLAQWAEEGRPGAASALALANNPADFLSTIQIGITVIGILSGAYAEATISAQLADALARVPLLEPYARQLALALVVVTITYFSLIFGELVPKRLALRNAAAIASLVARPMGWLAELAHPFVQLLSASSNAVLRLLGKRESVEPPVTEEEIAVLMDEGTRAGIFEPHEQELVERVFRVGEQRVGAIMTPRFDVAWIDLDAPEAEIRQQVLDSRYSRLPVSRGDFTAVVGVLEVLDYLRAVATGQPFNLAGQLTPPLYVPRSVPVIEALQTFRRTKQSIALVVDEFGEPAGIVTLADVLAALVGDMPGPEDRAEPDAVQREDGTWLIDGMVSIARLKSVLGIGRELTGEGEGVFDTLGGFVMTELGRVPKRADCFVWGDWRFEVVDMDRNRVDQVLVTPLGPAAGQGEH